MSVKESNCFFNCTKTGSLITGGSARIQKIIESSKERKDISNLDQSPNCGISFHNSCISSYTSKSHIQRELKRTELDRFGCLCDGSGIP